jgi:hypothetical protein
MSRPPSLSLVTRDVSEAFELTRKAAKRHNPKAAPTFQWLLKPLCPGRVI